MLKQKDMKRSDWHRILEKEYRFCECQINGRRGVASVLLLNKVTQPLTIHYDYGDVTIVNEGDTWLQIALENCCCWVTAMYNSRNELLQIYFDITNGNRLQPTENPTFEDLFLDLVLEPDGKLHELDRDELDDALQLGQISIEQHQLAVGECKKLVSYLSKHWMEFSEICYGLLMKLKYS